MFLFGFILGILFTIVGWYFLIRFVLRISNSVVGSKLLGAILAGTAAYHFIDRWQHRDKND
jgi:hypothetical protein